MPTAIKPLTQIDDSWIGRKVRWTSYSSLYTIRGVTLNGARAFISRVSSPQRVLSVPVGDLSLPEDQETTGA